MSEFKGIPLVTGVSRPASSGEKYQTEQGFTAIRDGIKAAAGGAVAPAVRKPAWLRAPLPAGAAFEQVKQTVREHRLATVCEEAKCPNIGECWNAGTATIMLMGEVCTRACRFCAVDTGNPRGWLDSDEPRNAARTVQLMRLKYVVLTSVNRDDLPDGGAAHFAACVREIKRLNPGTAVEALTPDFQGVLTRRGGGGRQRPRGVRAEHRDRAPPDAPGARSPRRLRADAGRAGACEAAPPQQGDVLVKTSLMLGLGETDAEILETMRDLRAAGVDLLTLGQYLRPTVNHLAVERFVTPQEFEQYRAQALALGFVECVSGPLVRSSYRAEQALARNNAGLAAGGLAPRG